MHWRVSLCLFSAASVLTLADCSHHYGSIRAIPQTFARNAAGTVRTSNVPASTTTLSVTVRGVNGTTLTLSTGSGCQIPFTYDPNTTKFDPASPLPVTGNHLQVTAYYTGSSSCPSSLASPAYVSNYFGSKAPSASATATITAIDDAQTFTTTDSTGRQTLVILNSVYDASVVPVPYVKVSVKGFGRIGRFIHATSALVSPAPSPPPAAHIYTGAYSAEFGYNAGTTATQVGTWLTYLEGQDDSATQLCGAGGGNSCTPLMYWDVGFIAVPFIPGCTTNCDMNATDLPWHGGESGTNCPAAASLRPNGGYITDPGNGTTVEEWFLHAAGTDPTNSANRIVSDFGAGRNLYFWYAWPGSQNAQAFQNQVIANCLLGPNAIPLNNYGGVFADDAWIDLSKGYASFALKSYYVGANVGTRATAPYYSGSCSDLYTNAPCTQSNGVLSTSTTTTAECSSDSCWNAALVSELGSWVHGTGGPYSGQPMTVLYNGLLSTDFSVLNGASNIVGAENEKHVTDEGGFTNANYMGTILDVGATVAHSAPQKRYVIENVAQGTDSIGSTLHQNKLRMIYALEWMVFYPNLVDWSAMEDIAGASFGSNGVGVWPMDFLYPTQPMTTANAASPSKCSTAGGFGGSGGPCTSGGAFDSNICVTGTAPKCVYRREFKHCFWQPNYNTTAPGTDIGPCAALVNLEDGPVTIQQSWFKEWSLYNGLISLCTVGSGGTYSAPNCTGDSSAGVSGSSGGDVNMNGATIDCSLPKNSVTAIPHFDAVFFTAQSTPQC